MAVYAITGKLGSGKGKAAIMRLREYLKQGKRVATNCDVFLEHLMPERSKMTVTRVPDKPSSSDLYAIGSGNAFIKFEPIVKITNTGYEFTAPSPALLPGFDEMHNGALVLDECGSWLNTRDFQSKGRSGLLEWAIHARKYGWDVYFICQNIKQVDAQLRESLFEYVVRLTRLDRLKIPFLSAGVKLFTAGYSDGSLPRLHIGVVRLGSNPVGLVADRWTFRGDDLNNAYNTTQVFSETYPHAIHTVLSAWHLSTEYGVPVDFAGPVRPNGEDARLLKSRPLPPKPPHPHMTKFLALSGVFGCIVGAFGFHILAPMLSKDSTVVQKHVYADKLVGTGYFRKQNGVVVVLSDGRSVTPLAFNVLPAGWEAKIGPDMWVMGISQ